MVQTTGIRNLKARLSSYLNQVKRGATIVITERGTPIGHIIPAGLSLAERIQELGKAGLVRWSGRSLKPRVSRARVRGRRTVADLLLEDRE